MMKNESFVSKIRNKTRMPTFTIAILFVFNKFIYLFLVALGLRCYMWAFSSCREKGLLFVVVHRLLIELASLVAEHGL